MCNINFVYKRDNSDSVDLNSLMNTVSYISFQSNSDGDGYFARGADTCKVAKSSKKLIIRENAHLMISHQRFATSGDKTNEYAHPFETDDLIVIHNGVFYGLASGAHSDTYVYAQRLQKHYVELNGDFLKAVCEVHKDLYGSYSIFVYDKRTSKLYYYKNNGTSFTVLKHKNYLFGSTLTENVAYAKKFLGIQKAEQFEPKAFRIWDVLEGWVKCGKMPQPTWQSYGTTKVQTAETNREYWDEDYKNYREGLDWDKERQCWVDPAVKALRELNDSVSVANKDIDAVVETTTEEVIDEVTERVTALSHKRPNKWEEWDRVGAYPQEYR